MLLLSPDPRPQHLSAAPFVVMGASEELSHVMTGTLLTATAALQHALSSKILSVLQIQVSADAPQISLDGAVQLVGIS